MKISFKKEIIIGIIIVLILWVFQAILISPLPQIEEEINKDSTTSASINIDIFWMFVIVFTYAIKNWRTPLKWWEKLIGIIVVVIMFNILAMLAGVIMSITSEINVAGLLSISIKVFILLLFLLCEFYFLALHDYGWAIKLAATNTNPEYSSRLYFDRGLNYSNLKQYQKAIENFTEAIELDPKDAVAYCNRGLAYVNLGKYQSAIEDFTKAINLNPKLVEAHGGRGIAYDELGEYQKAVEDYDNAIKLDPQNARAHHNRKITCEKINQRGKI